MKKSEAAAKWCPMYRVQVHMGEYVDNRAGFPPSGCITDDCTCWVELENFWRCPTCQRGVYHSPTECPVCGGETEHIETGRCGLAK